MLKEKFLHRHGRSYNHNYYDDVKSEKHHKNLRNVNLSEMSDFELFEDVYGYVSKKPKYYWFRYNYIDITPLIKFLESRIGCDWNEVYSEVLSKTKKRYRSEVENTLRWAVCRPVYDEDYIPHDARSYRTMNERMFINLDNKLVRMTEDDIFKEANKRLRKDKMEKLLKAIKEEETNYPLDL